MPPRQPDRQDRPLSDNPSDRSWVISLWPPLRSRFAAGRRELPSRAASNKYQPACKPGSVWRVAPPRRPFIWDAGCPAPRATNPGGWAWKRAWLRGDCSPQARPPLFGLAPGGVCHAASVAGSAVRSYRTVSPLPGGSSPPSAVCFLWHFPWGHPRRPLAATVFPWSPDFPPPDKIAITRFARQRPSGRLVPLHKGDGACRVKPPRCLPWPAD